MAEKRTCQTCGTRSRKVLAMPDPFTAALHPDEPHDEVELCEPCAVARFEES
jgi:hypothetical protein